MANKYATKSGNWSDSTVWNGGTLPTSSDDVYANTYTVTVDQNITVLTLRNTSASGITAGGTFSFNSGLTINATSGLYIGVQNAFLFSGTTLTINASIISSTLSYNQYGFNISAGTVNFNGNIFHSSGGNPCYSIGVTGTGNLNVTGNVTASGGGAGNDCIGMFSSTGTLNITGNLLQLGNYGQAVYGSAGGLKINITGNVRSNGGERAILIDNAATVTITGEVLSTGTGNALTLTSGASILSIIGKITASTSGNPMSCSGISTLSGPFISSSTNFYWPLNGSRIKIKTGLTNSYLEFRDESNNIVRWQTSDLAGGNPAASDVRSGIKFGASLEYTGTCSVPPSSSVAYGVPVDNTTGTAALKLNDVASVVAAQIAATLGTP